MPARQDPGQSTVEARSPYAFSRSISRNTSVRHNIARKLNHRPVSVSIILDIFRHERKVYVSPKFARWLLTLLPTKDMEPINRFGSTNISSVAPFTPYQYRTIGMLKLIRSRLQAPIPVIRFQEYRAVFTSIVCVRPVVSKLRIIER